MPVLPFTPFVHDPFLPLYSSYFSHFSPSSCVSPGVYQNFFPFPSLSSPFHSSFFPSSDNSISITPHASLSPSTSILLRVPCSTFSVIFSTPSQGSFWFTTTLNRCNWNIVSFKDCARLWQFSWIRTLHFSLTANHIQRFLWSFSDLFRIYFYYTIIWIYSFEGKGPLWVALGFPYFILVTIFISVLFLCGNNARLNIRPCF